MVQGDRVGVKGPKGRSFGNEADTRGIGKPQQKRSGGKPTPAKKGGKLTSVKNQIRAVKRLLARGGLAPKALAEQERRLEQLTDSLEKHQKAETARKYATKYHKVRFFERVKIERQITRLERQPAADSPEAAAERTARLASLRDNLTYVTHFPKEEKYVALLREAEDPEAQAALDAERARLRAIARQRAADAALVAEPDEGRALALASAGAAQAADSDEQDDFFLASDDDEGGAAAPDGNEAAGGSIDAAAFERATAASAAAHESSLKGKGGKQRQRPLGQEARGHTAAGRQRYTAPQQQQQQQQQRSQHQQPPAMQNGTRVAAKARQQHTEQRQDAPQWSQPAAVKQRKRPPPVATGSEAGGGWGHRPSKQHASASAGKPQPVQSFPHSMKPSGKPHSRPPVPAAAPAVSKPKEGQPLRKRVEGGRKRRKKQ